MMAGIGLYYDRSLIIEVALLNVSMDQTLWWLDCVGYLFTGKWVAGVAKYLADPTIYAMRKMTAFHHLWFLPLLVLILHV